MCLILESLKRKIWVPTDWEMFKITEVSNSWKILNLNVAEHLHASRLSNPRMSWFPHIVISNYKLTQVLVVSFFFEPTRCFAAAKSASWFEGSGSGYWREKYIEQLSSSSSSWFCHRRHDQPARAEAEEQLDRCNENGVPCLGWSACTWVGLVVISNVNVNVIISNVNVIKMISLTKHLQTPHQTPTCSMQRAGHSWGRLGLPTVQHPWMSWQLGLIWRWRWWLWWWWQLWRQQ